MGWHQLSHQAATSPRSSIMESRGDAQFSLQFLHGLTGPCISCENLECHKRAQGHGFPSLRPKSR